MKLALVILLIELVAKSRSTYVEYSNAVRLLPNWQEFDANLVIDSVNYPVTGTDLERRAIECAIADFSICEKFARAFRMAFNRPVIKKQYEGDRLVRVQLRYKEPPPRTRLIDLFGSLERDTDEIEKILKGLQGRSRNIRPNHLDLVQLCIDRGDTPDQIVRAAESGDRISALGESAIWVIPWEKELEGKGVLTAKDSTLC